MDNVTVTNEVEIRTTIALVEAIIGRHENGELNRNLQEDIHDVLFRVTALHGIADIKLDEAGYADAIDQLRSEVFVGNEVSGPAYTTYILTTLFNWPPKTRNIALAINLIRKLLRAGVRIEMKFVSPGIIDGVNYKNGWNAFYEMFGDAVRAAYAA